MEDFVLLLEDIVLWVNIVNKNEKECFEAKDKCVMLSDVWTSWRICPIVLVVL
jgi:hypothetical protein